MTILHRLNPQPLPPRAAFGRGGGARTKPGLTPNPEVLSRRLDETIVLVHIGTNRIFELNETGSRAWELLGQGLDLDSIVDLLVNEFEVEPQRAADELKALVVRLQAESLLVS